ncbi:hypothetical protein [Microcoleus vaginatus]
MSVIRKREVGTAKTRRTRRKREEGRRKREEGRRKKEEGRMKSLLISY